MKFKDIIREEIFFFVKPLHKMVIPPFPFYEVPIICRPFLELKKDYFELCWKVV